MRTVAISESGKYIVAGIGGNVTLFDNTPAKNKMPIWNYEPPIMSSTTHHVAISSNGAYIAAAITESSNGNYGYLLLLNTSADFADEAMWIYNFHSQYHK